MEELQALSENTMKYSVIIPVYNSYEVVGETIQYTVDFFESRKLDYELILVNDGSRDSSWEVVKEWATDKRPSQCIAIDLLKNYGQHSALFCGLMHASGDWCITLDDDLQIHPDEIEKLLPFTESDQYDLLVGRFEQKMHALHRKLGSRLVNWMNIYLFHKPPDLTITTLRCIRHDVVSRMLQWKTPYPYINGLMLMCSSRRKNIDVSHQPRKVGKSGYNFIKIVSLLMRILFNYSSIPLRLFGAVGIACSLISFLIGLYFVVNKILGGVEVPGWTSLIVLLSFFNGIILLFLSMIGEYLVRLVRQTTESQSFYIREIVKSSE